MGYNLKRLMNQYGVSTASKAGYAGQRDPGAEFVYDADAEAAEADQRATYDANKAQFQADKAAYDAYNAQYEQRLQNTPMYANKQFQTTPQPQPNTLNEMYEQYLGRSPELKERNRAYTGEGVPDWVNAPTGVDDEGNPVFYTQVMTPVRNPITGEVFMGTNGGYSLNKEGLTPLSDAQRKQFIRGGEQEYANLGINNTGNQAIMEQTGNYYGNVLKNPIYGTTSTGVGATSTVDGTTSILDDADLDFSGVTGIDDITIDMSANLSGNDTVGGFDYSNTNINTNDKDPTDPFATHNAILEQAAEQREIYGDNSLTEDLANLFTPWDGASYVDGALTYDEDGEVGTVAVPDDDDNYSGTMNSTYNDDGGDWSWSESSWNPSNWAEGGEIRGYAEGDSVIIDDESLEQVTDVPDLDELALANINNIQDSNTNIAALQRMLANSAMPSSTATSDARSALDTARADFSAMLQRSADTAAQGPSESEKWFRLAAAFGKPTQSGHFMENLGLANEALAGFKSDKRAAQSASDALLMQGAEFNLDYLKDDLANATAAGAAERDWKRGMAAELLEYERDQLQKTEDREFDLAVIAGEREYEEGKPKSAAAKIATDMGLAGEEYNEFIKEYYEREQAVAALEVEALTNQVTQLSAGELNLKGETETQIESAEASLALLDKALGLNKLAYGKGFYDSGKMVFLGQFDPEDPEYIATMELEQILSSNALASLKSTFGGQISDGERKSLSALQGIEAKSSAERERIIKNAAEALVNILSKRRIKLEKISSGEYGTKTPTGDK